MPMSHWWSKASTVPKPRLLNLFNGALHIIFVYIKLGIHTLFSKVSVCHWKAARTPSFTLKL